VLLRQVLGGPQNRGRGQLGEQLEHPCGSSGTVKGWCWRQKVWSCCKGEKRQCRGCWTEVVCVAAGAADLSRGVEEKHMQLGAWCCLVFRLRH